MFVDAIYNSTPPTATDGQNIQLQADVNGRLLTSAQMSSGSSSIGTVQPFSQPSSRWNYAAATGGIVNTTTAVTIKAAAGAGIRNHITDIQIQTAALGAATELVIRDGAGGTVLWRTRLQTTAHALVSVSFQTPLRGSENTLLEVATLTAVTGEVFFNAQGFVGG